MAYRTRVLTTSDSCVAADLIERALKKDGHDSIVRCEADQDPDDWQQLILSHPDGSEIALIERDVVEDGSLADGEIQEFEEELDHTLPQSSAVWLREFFPRVRCIYSFQHLSGANSDSGFSALSCVRALFWSAAPGLLQADGEGFSNEHGYQITWEFSESVTGTWWMGLLKEGKWVHFQMDLGNREHRKAFKLGTIPDRVIFA